MPTHTAVTCNTWCTSKGQTKLKRFFQADISSKKRTNEFYFTTMKPQVDLFSFVFWRKLKTPKRHFEIIWPLIKKSFWSYRSLNFEMSFWCLQFHPKNEQKQVNLRFHSSKAEFVRSFCGGNVCLKKSFRLFWPLIVHEARFLRKKGLK